MTDTSDDPLSRALVALASVEGADMPPMVAEVLKEVSAAILQGLEERDALTAVADRAMTLVEVLDNYESAIDDGNEEQIASLAEAGSQAEDALVDALNELHILKATDADLSRDAAYLAVLDGFGDDDEPRQ